MKAAVTDLLRSRGLFPALLLGLGLLDYHIPSFNLAGEPLRIMRAAQKLGGEEEKILATVVLEDFLRAVFLWGAAATVMSQDPPLFSPRVFSLARAGAILVSVQRLVALLGRQGIVA